MRGSVPYVGCWDLVPLLQIMWERLQETASALYDGEWPELAQRSLFWEEEASRTRPLQLEAMLGQGTIRPGVPEHMNRRQRNICQNQ